MTSTAVRVGLRVRPLTTKEISNNYNECMSFIPNEPQVILGTDKSFTFDYVFNPNTTQATVYNNAITPLLHKFIEGFNATVLAYGQTGAGKTYCMGTGLVNSKDEENQGIIPRFMVELFRSLEERTEKEGYSYEICVSFLELHNEDLIDLLNTPIHQKRRSTGGITPPQLTEVQIREDIAGNIYWTGVKEERCYNAIEVLELLEKGSLCRTTASTDMNSVSSRSHAMFSVILKQNRLENNESKTFNSKFHFVDLAGSERLKRTNAEGDRAKEGIAINSGLLALGNVISALGDETRRAAHIPYRDSKLTRLLQDSLGGNSQTLMIACVSPSDSNFAETLNTLRYANRARNIKNRVVVNQEFSDASMEVNSLRSLVNKLRIEINSLRSSAPNNNNNNNNNIYGNNNEVKLKDEISRLKFRLQDATEEMIKVTTERDTLLMERDIGTTLIQQQEENSSDSPESSSLIISNDKLQSQCIIQSHPIIENYIKTIQDLNSDLTDAKEKLDNFEKLHHHHQQQQQNMILSTTTNNTITPYHKPSLSSSRRRTRNGGIMASTGKRRFGGRYNGRLSANNSSSTATAMNHNNYKNIKSLSLSTTKKLKSLSKRQQQQHDNNEIPLENNDDEGFINDLQDETMRNEFKESIAKAREEIKKGMEFLELIKPGDEKDIEKWDKELMTMVQGQSFERSNSDEGNFSATTSPVPPTPTQLDGMEMMLQNWEDDYNPQDRDSAISSQNSTYQLDIENHNNNNSKHDPKLVFMIHQIQSDIKVKEELVSHLEKSETEYMYMRKKFDDKICHLQVQLSKLQIEKEKALKRTKTTTNIATATTTTTNMKSINATSLDHHQQQIREKQQMNEIKQSYESKMKNLMHEIQELKRKYAQTTSTMHVTRNQNESLLKSLRINVETLKLEKKQMTKRMKKESEKVRDQMTLQERQIRKLQKQQLEANKARQRLEHEHEVQKQTLKKKHEEVIMNTSQLKQLTCILKKAVREGGVLDEKLLSKVSHIVGGQFAIVSRNDCLGFPLRGGGHSRSSKINSNNKYISSIPLNIRATRKKNLLEKALSQYIQGKQTLVEMEQLLTRRERLVDEKQDLMDERRHIYLIEKERADHHGEVMDINAIDFIDERIDILSAEISYLSSRIHGLQIEAAAIAEEDDDDESIIDYHGDNNKKNRRRHRIEKHVTFADEIIVTDQPPQPNDEWADMDAFEEHYTVPRNATPELAYDITNKIIKTLKHDESKRIITDYLVQEILNLRMAESNRVLTMQNLEKQVLDMRRTLIVMKRAAVATTIENERRIRRLESGYYNNNNNNTNGTNHQLLQDNNNEELFLEMDKKMEEYISGGNTIFDKIYEDGLRGLINGETSELSLLEEENECYNNYGNNHHNGNNHLIHNNNDNHHHHQHNDDDDDDIMIMMNNNNNNNNNNNHPTELLLSSSSLKEQQHQQQNQSYDNTLMTPISMISPESENMEQTTLDLMIATSSQQQQQSIMPIPSFSSLTNNNNIENKHLNVVGGGEIDQTSSSSSREITPSPDRFYNMIQKKLNLAAQQHQLKNNDGDMIDKDHLTMIMTNPTEFRQLATTTTLHHDNKTTTCDNSSTSSILSHQILRSDHQSISPSSSSLLSNNNNKSIDLIPLQQQHFHPMSRVTSVPFPPIPSSSLMTTSRPRASSLQYVSSSTDPRSSSITPINNNKHYFNLSSTQSTATTTLENQQQHNVFNRLATTPTRASSAKLHRLSY